MFQQEGIKRTQNTMKLAQHFSYEIETNTKKATIPKGTVAFYLSFDTLLVQ